MRAHLAAWASLLMVACGGESAAPVSPLPPIGPGASSPTNIRQIAIGGEHACALMSNGSVRCWGNNASGQLGDGTFTNHATAMPVPALFGGVAFISAGYDWTCAITTSGGVKCWGDNEAGTIGDGTTTDRPAPMDVVGLSSGVVAMGSGQDHNCALSTDGGVRCWGANVSSSLGGGVIGRFSLVPASVPNLTSGVTMLSVGAFHSCALRSGTTKCFGSNIYGQLGDGTEVNYSEPVDVKGLGGTPSMIRLGGYHSCAVVSGATKCWGNGLNGQIGDGTSNVLRFTPTAVSSSLGGVTMLVGGSSHTCAVTTAGGAKCWGSNFFGQLGIGSLVELQTVPQDVLNLQSPVLAVYTGWVNTCAVSPGTGAKCWGNNAAGQVGDGTLERRLSPVSVVGLDGGT